MKIERIIKALAHENRLRISNVLYNGKFCGCELKNILAITQSNTSRHLNKLKQIELVVGQRDGKWIYYSLNQKFLERYKFVKQLLSKELDGEVFEKDLIRLNKYQASGSDCKDLEKDEDFFSI